MRAITIQNPYAWAVAADLKRVENRSQQHPWQSAVGEDLAIHASATWHRSGIEDPLIERAILNSFAHPDDVETIRGWNAHLQANVLPHLRPLDGKVLAVRRLLDVHGPDECPTRHGGSSWTKPRCDLWAQPDQWHLVFDSGPRLATPIPCRGFLGLWTLPARVDAAVRSQVALEGAR